MTIVARMLGNPGTPGSSNSVLGTITVVVEVFILMAMMTIVKIFSVEVEVAMILLFRFWFSLPGLFLLAAYQRGTQMWQIADMSALMIRSIVGFAGLVVMFIAISMVEISKVVALGQACAVFITLLAPLFLGEQVGIRRWMAVLAGFAGVLVILQPGTEGWITPGIIYALLSPLLAAFMFIYLRKLGLTSPPVSTALIYNCFGTCMITAWCLFISASLPADPTTWIVLAFCGVLSSFQQFFMATAYAQAPASTLAPVRYLSVPLSIVIGFLLFDEEITAGFLLGTLVIVLAAHYIVMRERMVELGRE